MPDAVVAPSESSRLMVKAVRLALNITDSPKVHFRNWVIYGLLGRVCFIMVQYLKEPILFGLVVGVWDPGVMLYISRLMVMLCSLTTLVAFLFVLGVGVLDIGAML